MTDSYRYPFVTIFILIAIVFILTFYVSFVSESVIVSILALIIAICAIIISYLAYKISSREREKPRIKELIDIYKEDRRVLSEHINLFNIFKFPESLNYRYELSYDKDLYKKLPIMNRITYSEVIRYSKLGKIIDEKIKELTSKAKEISEKTKVEDGGGKKWTFKGRYKKLNQDNKKELLKKKGLSNSIEDISTRVKKLIVEAKELDKELKKKILKLEKIYFTEYK